MPLLVQGDGGASEIASALVVGSFDKSSVAFIASSTSFLVLNLFLRRFHAAASAFDFFCFADGDNFADVGFVAGLS